jgi:hypothetical protein
MVKVMTLNLDEGPVGVETTSHLHALRKKHQLFQYYNAKSRSSVGCLAVIESIAFEVVSHPP